MKRINQIFVYVVFALSIPLFLFSSCKEKPLEPDEMKDAAGNRYRTVTIGKQVWMAENLNALYINKPNNSSYLGDAIPAAFWFPFDEPLMQNKYGLLYSWDAAKDLLPKGGWRIPTLQDFEILLNELGANYDSDSDAVVHALSISDYPGSNEPEIMTLYKYFSLLLNEPSTSIAYDHLTIRIHARDLPDDRIYKSRIYTYNTDRFFASSVRFVKDVE